MTVKTERYVFDANNVLVGIGRAAGQGETLRNLNRSQVDPGASIKVPYYWNGSKVVRGSPPNPLVTSTVQALQAKANRRAELERRSGVYPSSLATVVHDYDTYDLHGFYLFMTNNAGQTLTSAQRQKGAEEWASSPSDVQTAKDYYDKALGRSSPTSPISTISIPTDGSNPSALDLKDAVSLSGSVPASVDLLSLDWALGLT